MSGKVHPVCSSLRLGGCLPAGREEAEEDTYWPFNPLQSEALPALQVNAGRSLPLANRQSPSRQGRCGLRKPWEPEGVGRGSLRGPWGRAVS